MTKRGGRTRRVNLTRIIKAGAHPLSLTDWSWQPRREDLTWRRQQRSLHRHKSQCLPFHMWSTQLEQYPRSTQRMVGRMFAWQLGPKMVKAEQHFSVTRSHQLGRGNIFVLLFMNAAPLESREERTLNTAGKMERLKGGWALQTDLANKNSDRSTTCCISCLSIAFFFCVCQHTWRMQCAHSYISLDCLCLLLGTAQKVAKRSSFLSKKQWYLKVKADWESMFVLCQSGSGHDSTRFLSRGGWSQRVGLTKRKKTLPLRRYCTAYDAWLWLLWNPTRDCEMEK